MANGGRMVYNFTYDWRLMRYAYSLFYWFFSSPFVRIHFVDAKNGMAMGVIRAAASLNPNTKAAEHMVAVLRFKVRGVMSTFVRDNGKLQRRRRRGRRRGRRKEEEKKRVMRARICDTGCELRMSVMCVAWLELINFHETKIFYATSNRLQTIYDAPCISNIFFSICCGCARHHRGCTARFALGAERCGT